MIQGRENSNPPFWDCLDHKGPKNTKKINLGTKSIRETISTHTMVRQGRIGYVKERERERERERDEEEEEEEEEEENKRIVRDKISWQ